MKISGVFYHMVDLAKQISFVHRIWALNFQIFIFPLIISIMLNIVILNGFSNLELKKVFVLKIKRSSHVIFCIIMS